MNRDRNKKGRFKKRNGKKSFVCKNCGKEFEGYGNKKFCSRNCFFEYKIGNKHPQWRGGKSKYICGYCGKKFFDYPRQNRKYCSKSCSMKSRTGKKHPRWNGGKIELSCKYCGKGFLAYPNLKEKREYCSHECYAKSLIGKPRHIRDENHPNWKGGITPENKKIRSGIEFRLWREAVFARDNWTCQKYGTKGGKLHPHHIQNFADYPELRFAIDNGITLSEKAHIEFHKKYGKKNNTKEQLEEFLNNKYLIGIERLFMI